MTKEKKKEQDTQKKELEKKEEDIKEYINQIKRTQADFENYKKRIEKERDQMAQKEKEKLIKDILPILDSLKRATEASQKNNDHEPLKKGIELTHRNLLCILEKEGLRKIDCLKKQFDPHTQEAMMAVKSEGCKDNTVLEVLEDGYTIKDKVIRPAKVKVAKNE